MEINEMSTLQKTYWRRLHTGFRPHSWAGKSAPLYPWSEPGCGPSYIAARSSAQLVPIHYSIFKAVQNIPIT